MVLDVGKAVGILQGLAKPFAVLDMGPLVGHAAAEDISKCVLPEEQVA